MAVVNNAVEIGRLVGRSVGWLCGRSVCDRRTFPILRSTCSWRV